ncbi:hypothetical protein V8C86DRAFT_2560462 [Haematococcus lacustris]
MELEEFEALEQQIKRDVQPQASQLHSAGAAASIARPTGSLLQQQHRQQTGYAHNHSRSVSSADAQHQYLMHQQFGLGLPAMSTPSPHVPDVPTRPRTAAAVVQPVSTASGTAADGKVPRHAARQHAEPSPQQSWGDEAEDGWGEELSTKSHTGYQRQQQQPGGLPPAARSHSRADQHSLASSLSAWAMPLAEPQQPEGSLAATSRISVASPRSAVGHSNSGFYFDDDAEIAEDGGEGDGRMPHGTGWETQPGRAGAVPSPAQSHAHHGYGIDTPYSADSQGEQLGAQHAQQAAAGGSTLTQPFVRSLFKQQQQVGGKAAGGPAVPPGRAAGAAAGPQPL